ncbi:MAG TPA: type II secretion system protein [Terriglobales bacterium]|nr:type II secretion system protein [Terriglobales bacterium]
MFRRGKFRNSPIARSGNRQDGYMMLVLMLSMALLTIGLLAVLPAMKQQILRDREDEMRHRGTAYMRAIQHFYKKYNRYPNRVEELENTNNLHFIRKRYKDPMSVDPETGKERDFKFLHQSDVSLNIGPVLGQGVPGQGIPGAPGQPGLAGGAPGGALNAAAQQLGASALGAMAAQASGGIQQTTPPNLQAGANGDADSEGGNSGGTSGSSGSKASSDSSSGFNGPTFGGGPILGVVSTSKAKSIRVFYEKDHYKDWLFIYVPGSEQGGLLKGPINPGMPTGGGFGGVNPGAAGGLGGGITPGQGVPNGLQQPQFPTLQTPTPQNQPQSPPEQ